MKVDFKELVLVVGMHRTGSSVLVRGLQTLGVDLGADFHPARPDNPLGDWEDRHFHSLNEEMLTALNRSWDSVTPLDPAGRALIEKDFLPKALELVENCLQRKSPAGLKDPRFSILLPFWQEVFIRAGISVSYILSFRNPLSVADSLQRRDGFSQAKAFHLWAMHNIAILAEVGQKHCLVVDYDELMDHPGEQLQRIGTFLYQKLDPAALKTYLSTFLNPELRHTRFSSKDLDCETKDCPLVFEIYEMLRVRSLAPGPLSEGLETEKILAWRKSLEDLSPL